MSAGFENAPVTRLVVIAIISLTVILGNHEISLDLTNIMNGQVWRLFTSQLVFENMAQGLIGTIILYTTRQFERQLGVRKYAAFTVISYLLSLALQIAIISLCNATNITVINLTSGPYFIIFSSLVLYFLHIPKLFPRRFGVGGIVLSEKSWIYFLAVQLMISNGLSSIIPSFIGIIIGFLYDRDRLSLQSFRLPRFVERVFSIIVNFVTSIFSRPRRQFYQDLHNNENVDREPLNRRRNQFEDLNDEMRRYGGFNPVNFPTDREPPSEEAITNLMGLGFDRPSVLRALEATNNNVDAAADRLLR